jgi:hypothetical protein
MFKYNKLVFCIITLFVLFSISGCANLGRIQPDDKVTASFKQFQINKNYNYYISGFDLYPTSIMGLHKAYKLKTDRNYPRIIC